MTEALNYNEEEQVLERITRNQLLIKELEEENALLKGYFKERPDEYPAGTHKEVGRFFVKVSSYGRINDDLARKVLSSREFSAVSKTVVDPAKARAILDADTVDRITKKYENRIETGVS